MRVDIVRHAAQVERVNPAVFADRSALVQKTLQIVESAHSEIQFLADAFVVAARDVHAELPGFALGGSDSVMGKEE